MSQAIDKIVFSGIIFVLVFAQLAFDGVHVWAYTVFEITVLLLFFLLFVITLPAGIEPARGLGRSTVSRFNGLYRR